MTRAHSLDAVPFDLDGTLADTTGLILRSFGHATLTHLGRESDDDDWLATMGMRLRVQMKDFARSGEEAEAMVETVACLKESDTRMAVVTSKARQMTLRTLACCGMEDVFEVLVTVDDVGKGKPDPEPVNLAMKRLGLERPGCTRPWSCVDLSRGHGLRRSSHISTWRAPGSCWIWGRRWLSVPRWRSRPAPPSRGLSG